MEVFSWARVVDDTVLFTRLSVITCERVNSLLTGIVNLVLFICTFIHNALSLKATNSGGSSMLSHPLLKCTLHKLEASSHPLQRLT